MRKGEGGRREGWKVGRELGRKGNGEREREESERGGKREIRRGRMGEIVGE